MQRRNFIVALLLGAPTVLTSFVGCGGAKKSPRGVVKFGGTATYGGEAIPKGFFITFHPDAGRDSAAVVEDGGKFHARYSSAEDGVEHGKLRVLIGWDEEDGGPVPEGFEKLATSYSTYETALEITVDKADENYALDFPKK